MFRIKARSYFVFLFGVMGGLCSGVLLANPCMDGIRVESVNVRLLDLDDINLPDFSALKGVFLTDSLLSSIADESHQILKEQGYWESTVTVESILQSPENCGAEIQLAIDPGLQTPLEGYRWIGLETLQPSFLEQLPALRAGERVLPSDRKQVRQTLLSTGFFRDVDEGRWEMGQQGLVLQFTVEELRQNALDGMIGYAPGPNGDGLLAGYGDLQLRNLLLPGNELTLRYEQLSRSVSRLDATVRQTYPAGLPVSLAVGVHFLQQDTLYLQQEFRAEGEYFLSAGFAVTGSGQFGRVRAVSTLQPDTRSSSWGLGFRWFSLDHAVVPKRGYDVRMIGEVELRTRIGVSETSTQELPARQRIQRFQYSGKVYVAAANRWVFALRSELRHMVSGSFLSTDLYRFGGTNTVRGYAEDQFRAATLAWADLEPRFLLDQETYLFVFGAYGWYDRPETWSRQVADSNAQDRSGVRKSAWIGSFGAGIAYQTPLGMMRISYALSPDDTFSSSKIHVALGLQ